MRRARLGFMLSALALAASSASAFDHDVDEFDGFGSAYPDEYRTAPTFVDEAVELPPFPRSADLIPIAIDAPHADFKYMIDPASVQTGGEGLTARLTVVIEARSGFQNIFFERYRCDTLEYKTIAYGTAKKTFARQPVAEWKRIGQRGGTGLDYRRDLVTDYLCAGRFSLAAAEILYRARYPGNIPTDNL